MQRVVPSTVRILSTAPLKRRGASPRFTRGAATLVETAIVMNIFLLFIFAIFEFGHFVSVKQLMDDAARDGARLAATGTATVTTAQIQALVTSELVNQAPTSLSIQVFQADPTTGANIGAWTNAGLGDAVAVQITGNYQPIVQLAALLPVPIPVRSEAIVYSESPN